MFVKEVKMLRSFHKMIGYVNQNFDSIKADEGREIVRQIRKFDDYFATLTHKQKQMAEWAYDVEFRPLRASQDLQNPFVYHVTGVGRDR